ncbi:MAG: glycosyltransferase family 2 protein [Luminiphilus sp.]|nr:glycosyltransferase family 2 protein [Luminiphilus sp.]
MPDHDTLTPATSRTNAAIIMPAFNEQASIAPLIGRIKESTGLPIWVIDDCSTDTTAKHAAEAGARVIRLPEQLGAWGATQTGLRAAFREQMGCVVTMDADGQHGPDDIKQLMEPIISGSADVVIGSCPERGSRLRHVAWWLMRLTSGLRCKDLTSGYRALNDKAIALMAGPSANHLEYQDVGVLLMFERARLRIVESPVHMPRRADGKSRIFSSWLAVTYYMAQTLVLGASKRRRPTMNLKKLRT